MNGNHSQLYCRLNTAGDIALDLPVLEKWAPDPMMQSLIQMTESACITVHIPVAAVLSLRLPSNATWIPGDSQCKLLKWYGIPIHPTPRPHQQMNPSLDQTSFGLSYGGSHGGTRGTDKTGSLGG